MSFFISYASIKQELHELSTSSHDFLSTSLSNFVSATCSKSVNNKSDFRRLDEANRLYETRIKPVKLTTCVWSVAFPAVC